MGWRWVAAWLIALPLIALAVLWPRFGSNTAAPAPAPATDPVVITHYQADYQVDAQGTLTASETITAKFPEYRHGIFRYWDITNPNVPGVRQIPTVSSIQMDGKSVRYELLERNSGRYRVAKIGDPIRYLTAGEHVFRIRYTVPGVLDPGSTGSDLTFASATGSVERAPSVFLWNVVAPGWENKIVRADVTVRLPDAIIGAQCSVGWGHGRGCADLTVAGDTLTVAADGLSARNPVTVRVAVATPAPTRAELPWSLGWEPVLGTSAGGAGWAGVATLLALVLGVALYNFGREKPPPSPLQYSPPDGIGPVQLEMIRTKSVGSNPLIATLFHLADGGYVQIRQLERGKWSVLRSGMRPDLADADVVGRTVAQRLGLTTPDATFTADGSIAAGKRLTSARQALESAADSWAFEGNLLVPVYRALMTRIVAGAALLGAALATFRAFDATLWVLPCAVLFVLCVPSWAGGYLIQRSAAGRELWSRAGGFHRMLSTDSAEARFDFAARADLYTANLPYAMAAGIADEWAQKYQTETGQPPPSPPWLEFAGGGDGRYRSAHSTHSGGEARPSSVGFVGSAPSFANFESSLSSSIGAYERSLRVVYESENAGRSGWGGGSRSRSSFGGGGRSSGGSRGGGGRGGGGGGGGSW